MQSITFTFDSGVTAEQQDVILAEVRRWEGVGTVGRLKPDATSPAVRRMCYAYVEDHFAEDVTRRISEQMGIRGAAVATPRKLL